MATGTVRVSKIWAPNAGEFRVSPPRFRVGNRCRLTKRYDRHQPEVVEVTIERVDGPYLGHSFGPRDAWLYRVREETPAGHMTYAVSEFNLSLAP